MFNFNDIVNNIKKLFNYKWSSKFFEQLKPTQNEIEVPTEVGKNIKTGTIFLYIYAGVVALLQIVAVYWIANSLGVFASFMGDWKAKAITNALVTAAISGAVIYFVAKFLTSEGKKKPLPYFIVFILTIVGTLFLIYSIFGSASDYGYSVFGLFKYNALLGILYLAAIAAEFIGYTYVAVGCIDFCLEANQPTEQPERPKEKAKKTKAKATEDK